MRQICREYSRSCGYLNIFGMYYILDTSKQKEQLTVLPAEKAAKYLRISDSESIRHLRAQYLINVSRIVDHLAQ